MNPVVKQLGTVDYQDTWQQMQAYTNQRDSGSNDELWVLQHPAVFTLGQAGSDKHLLNVGAIPVIKCDRGGQVTYHGPGQIVVYTLLDIRRAGIGIRDLVVKLEQAVIDTLACYGVLARGKRDAPGVYVENRKIAALGLRVRRGCTFHGLALNVDMDLQPFKRINPCGYQGLEVTSTQELGINADTTELAEVLVESLKNRLAT